MSKSECGQCIVLYAQQYNQCDQHYCGTHSLTFAHIHIQSTTIYNTQHQHGIQPHHSTLHQATADKQSANHHQRYPPTITALKQHSASHKHLTAWCCCTPLLPCPHLLDAARLLVPARDLPSNHPSPHLLQPTTSRPTHRTISPKKSFRLDLFALLLPTAAHPFVSGCSLSLSFSRID